MRNIWRILSILVLVVTLLSCFLLPPYPMAADDPGSKVSSSLIKAIDERATHRQPLLSGAVQEPAPDPLNVSVFIYTYSKPEAAQVADMSSLGVTAYMDSWIPPVGTHPQGFITALVPISKIDDLAAKNYVVRLDSAEGQSYRMNDVAATDIKAATFYSGGYTGAGVRVAILDNGLDTTHPDFPVPVFAKDYWNYPIIGDNVTSPNPGGSDHGTHVAGSVLGRGTMSGGKYKGMAYGAELVFIKIGNNIPGSGSASNAAMCGALKDAVDKYGANIVSMSYGGWSPQHDGTDANCQAADYAVSKGATVFISAGNEADKGKHYKGTVNANSTTDFIKVNVTNSNGTTCTLEHTLVWYDGVGVHNELTVQYYNDTKNVISTKYYAMEPSTRGTERRQFEMTNPTTVIPAGDSIYYIRVTNTSTIDKEFHIYYDGAPSSQVKFDSPNIYYTLGSPGEADNVICVGSYNSRRSWTDYSGETWNFGETLSNVSSFSSRGPRMDTGAPQKPNLVAPGSVIISCRDSSKPLNIYTVFNNDSSGLPANYYAMQGTSMATPIAAGSAALLMQAYPGLKGNPAEVKRLLTPDNTPDSSFGYGLIDLQKTYNKAPQSGNVQSSTGQGQVTFSTNAGTIGRLNATGAGSAPQGSGLYTFPFGLFSYDISDLSIGETIQVTVTLPAAGPTQWVKSTANGWEQVPVISVNGNVMVIQLTDGGIGDDDGADGDIEDPGGPVIISSAISTRPPSSSATMSATPPTPPIMLPNVTVQSARLSTTAATPGMPVTVTADIINRSTVNGNRRVMLYVNGQVETTQSVTVNSGGSSKLTFDVFRSEPGDYTVYVDSVPAGSFKVELFRESDGILIFSAALVGLAFVLGMVILWRRQ